MDERVVWRRLPAHVMPVDELTPGRRRMSEAGFDDSSDGSGMSVHLVEPGEDIERFLSVVGREADGVAELGIGAIRAAGYGIVRKPIPADPGHCEVTGRGATRKAKRKTLLKIAVLVREVRL
jgi:hypothetical protein